MRHEHHTASLEGRRSGFQTHQQIGFIVPLAGSEIVKLPAHRPGLPGKETMLTLHPLSPPPRRGLRDVPPVNF